MTTKPQPQWNAQICQEACEWFVEFRLEDMDAATRRRFDAWVRTSPEHLRAYLEIAAIWNEGPGMDSDRKFDIEALTALALADNNVIPLTPSPAKAGGSSHATSGRPWMDAPGLSAAGTAQRNGWGGGKWLALAASIAAAAIASILWLTADPKYSTATGEQRSIALDDGSTIELNSRSTLSIHYSKTERSIDLIEGQALFRVAKDSTRPFIVHSNNTAVRAVGTEFDVYKKKTGTVVTVIEGRVAVSSPPSARRGQGAAEAALLSAGDQTVVTQKSIANPASTNIAAATAWTQRRLIFESASIEEVAEEFNRYNTRQLIVQDAVADFHISGVFSSTDTASIVRFLRSRPGIEVREGDSEIRVLRK